MTVVGYIPVENMVAEWASVQSEQYSETVKSHKGKKKVKGAYG